MTHPGWSFFQDFPAPPDLWAVDRALQAELRRRLPPELAHQAAKHLEALGKATATTLARLVVQAEAQEPVHVPYDPWGRRVDEIRTSPAWDELKAFSARHGLVATGYEEQWGEHRRIVQAAMLHLFSASSAIFSCPLAMTDAATRVLTDIANAPLRDRLVPRLLSRDPTVFITSGQWMTERTGGSDVGGTSTIARKVGGGGVHPEGERYTLHGTKWFTSAVTSEMALTLARIVDDQGRYADGSKRLSLFAVEIVREPGAGWRGITVNRLKDKLGTRALPTAELTLDGVEATLLGEPGRGVANIAGMLNVTRFYNAIASSSTMHKAHAWARAYAWKRAAFGAPIASHPLHAATLDEMEAEAAGATALAMEVATLLGRLEARTASDDERRRPSRASVVLVTSRTPVCRRSCATRKYCRSGRARPTSCRSTCSVPRPRTRRTRRSSRTCSHASSACRRRCRAPPSTRCVPVRTRWRPKRRTARPAAPPRASHGGSRSPRVTVSKRCSSVKRRRT
jgi:putative acyl-CoA dehydrogenase